MRLVVLSGSFLFYTLLCTPNTKCWACCRLSGGGQRQRRCGRAGQSGGLFRFGVAFESSPSGNAATTAADDSSSVTDAGLRDAGIRLSSAAAAAPAATTTTRHALRSLPHGTRPADAANEWWRRRDGPDGTVLPARTFAVVSPDLGPATTHQSSSSTAVHGLPAGRFVRLRYATAAAAAETGSMGHTPTGRCLPAFLAIIPHWPSTHARHVPFASSG